MVGLGLAFLLPEKAFQYTMMNFYEITEKDDEIDVESLLLAREGKLLIQKDKIEAEKQKEKHNVKMENNKSVTQVKDV